MTTKRSFLAAVLLFGLVVVGVLSAHDAQGPATKGQIVSVAGDTFVMKTDKGNMTVTLNKDTKIEHGDKAVDKTHLMKGEKVTVYGTKLPSGEFVAKEVMMGTTPAASKAKTEHKH